MLLCPAIVRQMTFGMDVTHKTRFMRFTISKNSLLSFLYFIIFILSFMQIKYKKVLLVDNNK